MVVTTSLFRYAMAQLTKLTFGQIKVFGEVITKSAPLSSNEPHGLKRNRLFNEDVLFWWRILQVLHKICLHGHGFPVLRNYRG